MLCGKIGAGKSTLAARLTKDTGALYLSEDDWLSSLFADQMTNAADYARCAAKLRQVMGPHVSSLLNAGQSVVLDFPANTFENRKWMQTILTRTSADHQLHVLHTPDEICLARLHARNAAGKHPFAATEAQFHQFSKHYAPPTQDEGFTLVHHDRLS